MSLSRWGLLVRRFIARWSFALGWVPGEHRVILIMENLNFNRGDRLFTDFYRDRISQLL